MSSLLKLANALVQVPLIRTTRTAKSKTKADDVTDAQKSAARLKGCAHFADVKNHEDENKPALIADRILQEEDLMLQLMKVGC